MMFRPWTREHWFFQRLLAALLLAGSATAARGQPGTYPTGSGPGAMSGAAPGASPGSAATVAEVPAPDAPPSAGYAHPASYAQPLAVQPPGTGPVPPPWLRNIPRRFWPPSWRHPARYPPIPPAPYPAVPVLPIPARPSLPDMVYVVTAKTWFRADALLWWTKSAPVAQPIVTTGSLADSVPGAVGQPGTQVLFGNASYGFSYVGGVRFETGVWLDPGRVVGVEAGYFVLIEQERDYANQSDMLGNPVIARPTINAASGKQSAYYAAVPDQIVGGVNLRMRSEFQGANCDGALNLLQTQSVRLDGLAGFRYLSLSESLSVGDQLVEGYGGTRAFAGAPINMTDTLSDLDSFRTTNSFYGGSAGARLYYAQGRWYVTALGKAALGQVQEVATIIGTTTMTGASGHATTLPGGVLATSANMGRHYQSVFAVAPEGHLNLGYQITPLVTVRVGYTFIYLSNVARPGNQITRVSNPNLVPSDPSYHPAATSTAAFQFQNSSYWAQGLNFGLDFRF